MGTLGYVCGDFSHALPMRVLCAWLSTVRFLSMVVVVHVNDIFSIGPRVGVSSLVLTSTGM